MKLHTALRFTAFSLLSLLLVAGAASAELATVSYGSSNLSWSPQVAHEGLMLTVSGPAGVHERQAFGAGDAATFSIFDSEGNVLADGSYNWELRATAKFDGETRSALEAAGDEKARRAVRAAAGVGQPEDFVMSGSFSIVGGALVNSGLEEASDAAKVASADAGGLQAKAQTFATDLIVQGSECVGIDCTTSESFGFDTIRLKENNLRIKFDDTSASASFPGNDWELTANDSSNGGTNRFSITDVTGGKTPFTVQAGAPNNAAYLNDSGNLGLGTATPAVDIHVVNGNSPTLRLDQDGSSGFTPQSWDLAGNETNFFVRDVTNGSKLPFRIKPGAPTDSVYVDSDEQIGLGTDAPTASVHVKRSSNAAVLVENTSAAADGASHAEVTLMTGGTAQGWKWRANGSTQEMNVVDDTSNTVPFKIGSGADTNLLQVGTMASNRIDITGELYINGVDNSTPDYVFEPDFELETIEEHADFMWREKHLPAMLKATTGEDGKAVINMAHRAQGLLEELEKAHIYIDQLNGMVKTLTARLDAMEAPEAAQ